MTSGPDARPDGPRYPTLLEQMQAWYRDQLAKNPPTTTQNPTLHPPTSAERRVPHDKTR